MKTHLTNIISLAVLFIALFLNNHPARAELEIDIATPATSPNETDNDNAKTDATKATEAKEDVARFKNGDSLHGTLLSFSPENGMVWQSPEAKNEIVFKPANLRKIQLASAANLAKPEQDVIFLTNGDEIYGNIVTLNADTLILKTPFAGRLTIARPMIESITPGSGADSDSYSGPTSIDDWKVSKQNGRNGGTPTVVDGVMTLPRYTSASRDMNLQPSSSISFNFETLGSSQFQLHFCSSSSKVNARKSNYNLSISQNYIYLQRSLNGSNQNLGNVRIRKFGNGKGTVTILFNSKEKGITMLANGKMVKQWTDAQFPVVGKYVSFYNQSSGVLKISKIQVGKWNGKVPGSKPKIDTKKDTIAFINDDKVTGQLKSMDAKLAVFETEYAPLKVPITRIKRISLASESRGRARRNNADARFVFTKGGHVTLNVSKIVDGKIVGESENFGEATFKLKAFKTVKLNIYND